jgi:cathepsin C
VDYKYLGGSYGKCNEQLMMEELYKRGPFVVSFEPDYSFMMYNSGIYNPIEDKTWLEMGFPRPEWERIDHAVLLVGWGNIYFL